LGAKGNGAMKSALFLAFAKLKGGGRVLAAARHNKRELQLERGATSHINAQRSMLNYCLAGNGTAAGIDDATKRAIAATGRTLRKDAVRVIEAVFSLPRNSAIDHRSYFVGCTRWIAERFGEANILSSDVHLDEAAPHCHVLFLPLVDGRMRGSDLLGGRARLAELANDFHAKVATLYGLPRRAPKLVGDRKQQLAKIVVERLLNTSDRATGSTVWQSIRESIESDPERFAAQLGVELPESNARPKRKSFTETMIGKGKQTSEDAKPIRFVKSHKTSNPILCRVRSSADDVSQPKSVSDVSQLSSALDVRQPVSDPRCANNGLAENNSVSNMEIFETTRVRDHDHPSDQYDSVTGDFIPRPKRQQLQKLASARWVNVQFSTKRRAMLATTK
jgi:Plasmid recombination enzyme